MKIFRAKICILYITSTILFSYFNILASQTMDASWYIKNAPFKMPSVILPVFPKQQFSIKDFGAINDGQTLNTAAFAKTIDACAAGGGGTVIVPRGTWLTGPIQLKSNVNLEVEAGALIQFTKDHTCYPMIKASSKSSNFVPASPIYGYDLKNVAITGAGIIDGAGETWRPVKKMKTTSEQWKDLLSSGGFVSTDGTVWWPGRQAMEGEKYVKKLKQKDAPLTAGDYLPARDFLRPYMVYLVNCQNILIENITLRNSPKFVFYPNSCANLTMRSVKVFNEWWAQNGDGIDISRCKNVLIYRCNVSVGDDGICMKSSGENKPGVFNLENVIIAECTVYHAHGGFVIGSNTDGRMQNIFVTNCHFIGSDVGVRVKSNTGRGGLVQNIYIRNIYMNDIKNEAISFDTYYEDMPAGSIKKTKMPRMDKTPVFRDFYFDSIYCNGAKTAILIRGLPEMPVSKIHFENMILSADQGFKATDASDIDLEKVKIIPEKDPVYLLNNVKHLRINEGYFPTDSKVFIRKDSETTTVKLTNTDLRNEQAIETAGKPR